MYFNSTGSEINFEGVLWLKSLRSMLKIPRSTTTITNAQRETISKEGTSAQALAGKENVTTAKGFNI